MEILIAFTACIFLTALADILSIKTKAKLPAMAGIIVLYLLAVSLGMPRNYPELSGLATLGNVLFPLFVAAVTTNILPKDIFRQWKFIFVGCIAVTISMGLTILVGGLLFDLPTAFSGAAVACGGAFTGGMLVMDYLKASGFPHLVALPLLLATTLDLVGQPMGSLVMKHCVKRFQASSAGSVDSAFSSTDKPLNRYGVPYDSPENPSPFFTAWVPPKYETASVALFQLAVTVLLANWLGELTGLGWAFMLVIIGLIGNFLGIYRLNMLQRTESAGLIMCAIFAMIFQMLNDLTLEIVLEQLVPFCVIVVLGLLGLFLGGALGAKLLGCDPLLGAASAMGLFYFFPGVQNVICEVTRSYAQSEEEYDRIFRQISTPAIITAFMGSRFCLLVTTLLMPVILK